MAEQTFSGPAGGSGAAGCKVKLANKELPAKAIHAVLVDLAVDLPDMAAVTLNLTPDSDYAKTAKLGDEVEVMLGSVQSSVPVFKGEVTGIEPTFDAKGESRVVLRCFNTLHRMTRGKFSKTYEGQTFSDIANSLTQRYGLQTEVSGDLPTGKFEHLYQHEQSDWEFMLQVCGRIGAEVVAGDQGKIVFRPRNPRDAESNIKVAWGDAAPTLEKVGFVLKSAGMVTQVICRAWNPDTHEELEGKAQSSAVGFKLGDTDGGKLALDGVQDGGEVFLYQSDVPCFSKAECEALAKSKLEELLLNHVTGECVLAGKPELKAGAVFEIDCRNDRFNGKYRAKRIQHRYGTKSGGDGGFKTFVSVQRNATSAAS
jgi:phage protein D